MSTETFETNPCDILSFPLLYQAQHLDYVSDIPFWLDLAQQCGGPILELGCGTGRVLKPLAEAGFSIYGLDYDPGMLALCRKQISSLIADQVHIFQADLTNFRIDTHFPLIILPCNTFSTLIDHHRKSAITHVHAHLKPGGIFSFSVPNPETLARANTTDQAEIEMVLSHPETGNPVQVSYEITRSAHHVRLNWHYDHLRPDGHVSRMTMTTSHRLTTTDRYLHELNQSGFSIKGLFGDFDNNPFQGESPDLIIVAKRS